MINYSLIEPMGMVLYLENIDRQATCIHCGSITRKLHQNHELTVRDLPFGKRPIYLKDVGAKLKLEKPLGLKRLGIDERMFGK